MEQANNKNFWKYRNYLQPYANKLRNKGTMAEACLWKYVLRASKMKGYGFRRQRPILNYIADFMCKELMLVIEVDGSVHWSEEAQERDKIREKALEQAGFTILRFTNEEVLKDIVSVRERIEQWISEHVVNNLKTPNVSRQTKITAQDKKPDQCNCRSCKPTATRT